MLVITKGYIPAYVAYRRYSMLHPWFSPINPGVLVYRRVWDRTWIRIRLEYMKKMCKSMGVLNMEYDIPFYLISIFHIIFHCIPMVSHCRSYLSAKKIRLLDPHVLLLFPWQLNKHSGHWCPNAQLGTKVLLVDCFASSFRLMSLLT